MVANPPDLSETPTTEIIGLLGHDRFSVREAASKELLSRGYEILPEIAKHLESDNLDVRLGCTNVYNMHHRQLWKRLNSNKELSDVPYIWYLHPKIRCPNGIQTDDKYEDLAVEYYLKACNKLMNLNYDLDSIRRCNDAGVRFIWYHRIMSNGKNIEMSQYAMKIYIDDLIRQGKPPKEIEQIYKFASGSNFKARAEVWRKMLDDAGYKDLLVQYWGAVSQKFVGTLKKGVPKKP